MTTINPIHDTPPAFGASNAKPPKTGETDSFGITLDKALDKPRETEGAPANGLMEIASKELNLVHASDMVSGKNQRPSGYAGCLCVKTG